MQLTTEAGCHRIAMLGELNREVYQIVIKWIIFWSLLQSITFFLVYYTPLESLLWSFCWPDLLLWYLAGVSACVKVVAPRSLCTLPVHAAMRTKICTISGTAMRTRRLLHQGSSAPGLPLQAAHNFKKTDQLCQSLKPPFPLNGFDEQESHKVKSQTYKFSIQKLIFLGACIFY